MRENGSLVSVIVPIYNVRDYVQDAIKSILVQTYPIENIEVILVDDGSTDDSVNLALQVLDGSRLSYKLVQQSNRGLSAARNTGLQHAKGMYVVFLDSDDRLSANAVKAIVQAMRENQLDVLVFRHREISEESRLIEDEKSVIATTTDLEVTTYTGVSARRAFLNSRGGWIPAWGKAYKRAWLTQNGLKFIEGAYFEDVPFTWEAVNKKGKFGEIQVELYNYRIREGSISKNLLKHYNLENFARREEVFKTAYSDPQLRASATNYMLEFYLARAAVLSRQANYKALPEFIVLQQRLQTLNWRGLFNTDLKRGFALFTYYLSPKAFSILLTAASSVLP